MTRETAGDRWSDLERLATEARDAIDIYENPPFGQAFAAAMWRSSTCDAFEAAANPSAVLELIAAARSGAVGIGAADEPRPDAGAVGDLVGALRPFARFIDILESMGGNTPKAGG